MARTDRLLEGENPTSMFKQDARHWIAVYRQMISFKDQLLGRMRVQVRTLSPAARQEVIVNDVSVLELQLKRYQRRIEFWYARQWELEGLSVDEKTRTIGYRQHAIHLTKREFQLFARLADRSPAYTSAEQLLSDAWRDPDFRRRRSGPTSSACGENWQSSTPRSRSRTDRDAAIRSFSTTVLQ